MPELDSYLQVVNTGANNNQKIDQHLAARLRKTQDTHPIKQTKRQQKQQNCILLFNLPPVVTNSALVRQRALVQDCPTARSSDAASLVDSRPHMLGARASVAGNQCNCSLVVSNQVPSQTAASLPQVVPQNTALRAEQRRKQSGDMVSVVRPVMGSPRTEITSNCNLDNKPSEANFQEECKQSSVLDDFVNLDSMKSSLLAQHPDRSIEFKINACEYDGYLQLENEQKTKQQILLLRREQAEIDKHFKGQHRFVVTKLGDRRMNLQIIQSVWIERDFKHAIEKLVDLYQQGLMFAKEEVLSSKAVTCCLRSANTPLVVDVIGVMIMRPKLWSLEICQLLLPIIVNDLLTQQKMQQYENYVEVGLKALKLVVSNFSSLIITTLDIDNNGRAPRRPIGVNLSGEEREVRCMECARLLIEARDVIAEHCTGKVLGRLRSLSRELEQQLDTFNAALAKRHITSSQFFRRPRVGSII